MNTLSASINPARINPNRNRRGLRRFSKLTCFSTLFLIFAGSLVTSTGSGLSVPDWPLSYGTLFPPMVGGVRFEHSHRMIAATVGILMLVLTIWLARSEERRWVRNLSFAAMGAVVLQGLLGGITVLFYLPKPVSILHAVLAQTFFILTITIAYSQSRERELRIQGEKDVYIPSFAKISLLVTILIYIQLILGALMRHTGSGLAIPDFPTMGGSFVPRFDNAMLGRINSWRFDMNLNPVTMTQVMIHFLHRLTAAMITVAVVLLTSQAIRLYRTNERIARTVFLLNILLLTQIIFGALTVWSQKAPYTTSTHVVTGAALLGISVLLALQSFPVTMSEAAQNGQLP